LRWCGIVEKEKNNFEDQKNCPYNTIIEKNHGMKGELNLGGRM
jgi:hypothetical protein